MIYLYDNAIVKDIKASLIPESGISSVSVCGPEVMVDLAAQFGDDNISLPLIGLTRDLDMPIDTDRNNFTRLHKGVISVMDTDTNELYYEKVIPVKLGYSITILASNIADRDELERELLFKYSQMYFLTIQLPYEAKRKVRFGITIDEDSAIEHKTGVVEYITEGQLYQSIIHLKCEGCVLVHYTPQKLRRTWVERPVSVITKAEAEDLI